MPVPSRELRVLITAPMGGDAATMAAVLGAEAIATSICSDPTECLLQLQTGAGALLLTEEALEMPRVTELLDTINTQPPWSELPLIILTSGGQSRLANLLDLTAPAAGSVTLLERPMSVPTLLRSVQVALRSRRRQYQLRDLIAAQQRQHQALLETEKQFHTLADSIPNMAWWANPDGYITWYNQRWHDYTGTTLQQMRGWGWQSVHDPAMLPKVIERWRASIAKGEPFEMEFPLRGADGQFRWFLTRGTPVRDSAGKIVRWFGTNTDIGEIRQAREVLSRTNEQLELLVAERTAKLQELVGELEHFSYTITHDMRAPLRSIRGFAELVEEICQDEDQKLLLHRITTSAERMDLLITDALSYSRAVREHLPLGPVDLAALLRGMLDSYLEFQPPNARIRLDGPIPLVLGNQAGLTQVFSNLLANAVKFTKPGQTPEIHIRAELTDPSASPPADPPPAGEAQREGKFTVPPTTNQEPSPTWVRVWVEDNGIGISPTMLPRIFNLFARGSTDQPGTGLGLAMVRKVVDRMGGRVGVESQPGQGSRFWIELLPGDPRQPAPSPRPCSSPNRPGAIL